MRMKNYHTQEHCSRRIYWSKQSRWYQRKHNHILINKCINETFCKKTPERIKFGSTHVWSLGLQPPIGGWHFSLSYAIHDSLNPTKWHKSSFYCRLEPNLFPLEHQATRGRLHKWVERQLRKGAFNSHKS